MTFPEGKKQIKLLPILAVASVLLGLGVMVGLLLSNLTGGETLKVSSEEQAAAEEFLEKETTLTESKMRRLENAAERAFAPEPPGPGERIQEAEKRLAADPRDVEALLALASLKSTTGMGSDLREAVGLLNQALDLEPKNFQVQFELGATYMSLREYDKAEITMLKALELTPGSKEAIQIHSMLGNMFAYRAGQPEKAKQHWQRVLALASPESSAAKEAKYMLKYLEEEAGR